jgi:hypothetical protein
MQSTRHFQMSFFNVKKHVKLKFWTQLPKCQIHLSVVTLIGAKTMIISVGWFFEFLNNYHFWLFEKPHRTNGFLT